MKRWAASASWKSVIPSYISYTWASLNHSVLLKHKSLAVSNNYTLDITIPFQILFYIIFMA